jgi:hypothetical protein
MAPTVWVLLYRDGSGGWTRYPDLAIRPEALLVPGMLESARAYLIVRLEDFNQHGLEVARYR